MSVQANQNPFKNRHEVEFIATFPKRQSLLFSWLPSVENDDRDKVFDQKEVQDILKNSRWKNITVNIHSHAPSFLVYQWQRG